MKILQINNVYDFGSTGKITRDIHHGLLEKGYDSVVYYGRRYQTDDKNVYKICSEFYGKAQNALYRITGIKYGGCYLSTNKIIRAIVKEKPDVVHLQCLNGHFVNIYRLIEFLKLNKIPTVLTLHAEFMYTGGCGHSIDCNQWSTYIGCGQSKCPLFGTELKSLMGDKTAVMWKRMKEAFKGFDKLVVVSVSPWLMERAKISPILEGKVHLVIYNGIDIKIFHSFPVEDLDVLKEELGIRVSDPVVFHATPSFDNNPKNIKGGYYVLKIAEQLKDVIFLVAGEYDKSLTVPKNVKLLGNVTDKIRMAMLYSLSNVTLLTSKRETFSMVCAESLCCGTPVVGFKAGAPELISMKQYSQFCEYADLDSLIQIIRNYCNSDKKDFYKEAHNIYGSKKMCDKYIKLYSSMQ